MPNWYINSVLRDIDGLVIVYKVLLNSYDYHTHPGHLFMPEFSEIVIVASLPSKIPSIT